VPLTSPLGAAPFALPEHLPQAPSPQLQLQYPGPGLLPSGTSNGPGFNYYGVASLPHATLSGNTWSAVLHLGSSRLSIGTYPSASAAAQAHDIVVTRLQAGGAATEAALASALAMAASANPLGGRKRAASQRDSAILSGGELEAKALCVPGGASVRRHCSSGTSSAMASATAQAAASTPSLQVPVVCGSLRGTFDVATLMFMLNGPEGGAGGASHRREQRGADKASLGMTGTEFERRAGQGSRKKWRNSVFVCSEPGGPGVEPLGVWLERHEREQQGLRLVGDLGAAGVGAPATQSEDAGASGSSDASQGTSDFGSLLAQLPLNFPGANHDPSIVSDYRPIEFCCWAFSRVRV